MAPSSAGASAAAADVTRQVGPHVPRGWASPGATSYPITYQSWDLVYATQPNANDAAMLKAYLGYLLGPGQQLLTPLELRAAAASIDRRPRRSSARSPSKDDLHDAGSSITDRPVLMSATLQADPATPAGSAAGLSPRRPLGDRAFQLLALASGLLVLVILVLIAVTIAQQSTSVVLHGGLVGHLLHRLGPGDTASSARWPSSTARLVTSVIAIIIAFPVSIGVALLLTEVVPRRWSQPIVYVIDLLAVVPVRRLGPVGHPGARSPGCSPSTGSIASASTASRCSTTCSASERNEVSGASFFTAASSWPS